MRIERPGKSKPGPLPARHAVERERLNFDLGGSAAEVFFLVAGISDGSRRSPRGIPPNSALSSRLDFSKSLPLASAIRASGRGYSMNRRLNFKFLNLIAAMAIGVPLWVHGDDPKFPYQAFALRDGALVRSGPGPTHYATDELTQGQVVEVWRDDPGGWYAIRPPRDSFSLIPQSAVEILDDRRCRVTEPGLQAWVGTRLGPVENPLWQVQLNEGEELVILGEVSWPSPEGHSLLWFQISPPDGEFRWIHRDDLQFPDALTQIPPASPRNSKAELQGAESHSQRTSRTPGEIQLAGQYEETSPDYQEGDRHNQVILDPFGDEETATPESTGGPSAPGWRRASRPTRYARLEGERGNFPRAGDQGFQNRIDSNYLSASGPVPPSERSATGAADSFNSARSTSDLGPLTDRLRQIDLDLSLEIVKPAESWDLRRLQQRLLDTQSAAASERERSQADALLAKLDRLAELQRNLTGGPPTINGRNAGLTQTSQPTGSGVAASVEFGTTYDAYGWLNECVQESGRKPSTFVLQDENGKILCQVTPSPGLNLHRYLKNRIGIVGPRGFNQKLNLNHVTADRVVVLEKPDIPLR